MDEIPAPEDFERTPDEPDPRARRRQRIRVAVTLILVIALVVLAAVEGSGFIIRGEAVKVTPTPAAARLAVVDAAGALTSVDDRGGSSIAFAAPGVTFQCPACSPDGSQLAAIGASAEGSGVYVFRTLASADPPGEPVVIYQSIDRPPFYLYWTPDGRQLTFLTTEPDGLALRVAPSDASFEASVVRAGAPMYWDFVDPGRLLVHSGLSGADGFLAEVGLNGAPFEATGGSPGVFRAPAVSRDGRYQGYLASGSGATGEVVLGARDGSTSNRVRVFGPAAVSFNPQGDQLAFVAPDQPNAGAIPLPVGPLRLMNAGTTEARTLIGGNVVAFFWSPTGEAIAALLLENPDNNVTQAGLSGVALARADVSAGGIAAAGGVAAASVAGQEAAAGLPLRLAFVDVATGSLRSERVVRLSDTFVNQVLPFFDQYALSHRFWSPDGAAIALPVVGDGDVTQLLVIPADGSDARAVATGEMGFWSP
jgi:TolB protein